jgi:hypothetical protein
MNLNVLIKCDARAVDRSEQEPQTPPKWTGPHVARRLRESFATLEQMPADHYRGVRGAWPPYKHDWADLLAHLELDGQERAQAMQNCMCVSPARRDIAHMEQALYWSMQYLAATHAHLCEAVNAVARAHSLGLDAGSVARERGGCAETWRQRHDRGCELIAAALIEDRVPVF